jgi:hypothetical protein
LLSLKMNTFPKKRPRRAPYTKKNRFLFKGKGAGPARGARQREQKKPFSPFSFPKPFNPKPLKERSASARGRIRTRLLLHAHPRRVTTLTPRCWKGMRVSFSNSHVSLALILGIGDGSQPFENGVLRAGGP